MEVEWGSNPRTNEGKLVPHDDESRSYGDSAAELATPAPFVFTFPPDHVGMLAYRELFPNEPLLLTFRTWPTTAPREEYELVIGRRGERRVLRADTKAGLIRLCVEESTAIAK